MAKTATPTIGMGSVRDSTREEPQSALQICEVGGVCERWRDIHHGLLGQLSQVNSRHIITALRHGPVSAHLLVLQGVGVVAA